ncbi:YcaO-like family protein [Mobiluncus mulieris]|uniref:YcaO-like family protein n=1 Tax=Mobiluncus mulieris TaxID=2052 RepID=UPI0014704B14|nr:YcaO-like family protein [Mobiluncus mulieris]MCU9971895.1 SagD family bacteriocin biosynthesis docking scaffold [Mobiluncus mulieris]NMW91713.1 SagD family bacteriocin biosynthesis docking scaffold [Mobiluncus mulieris]
MWGICAELRPLDCKRSLLTCADGTDLVLFMGAPEIAQALSEAEQSQSENPLGANLAAALSKHDCFVEISQLLPSGVETSIERLEEPEILVCGCPEIALKVTSCLREQGVVANYLESSIRECAYSAFNNDIILVACRGEESPQVFSEAISDISSLCISLIIIDYEATLLNIGPVIWEGVGASYEDSLVRKRANSVEIEAFQAKLGASVWGNFIKYIGTSQRVFESAAQLLKSIAKCEVDKQKNTSADTIWKISLAGELEVHAALPCKFIMPANNIEQCHPSTFVVDSDYGIVKHISKVKHTSYMPKTLHTTQARTCDLRRIGGYLNTVFCQGSRLIPDSLSQTEKGRLILDTRQAAIGESIERYCSNLIDLKPVLQGSYQALSQRGIPVLNPGELVLFSSSQYKQHGFPFTPFDRDLPVEWVEGRYLDDDSPIFVPASMVYVNWYSKQYATSPRVNFPAFAGVAAGTTFEQACLSGISEIIERHATMVWWLNAYPLSHINLRGHFSDLFDGVKETLRGSLIHLDNTFGIPVVAGVVHNDTSKLVHIGFSCRSTVKEAAFKAWSEALTLQEGAHDLNNPNGTHWQAINKGLLPGRSYKRWRLDRNYLDDFRLDLKDVDDLLVQQELYLDPRAVKKVAPLLDLPPSRDIDSINQLPDSRLETYLSKIARRGMRVIVVDITSPDVASCGWKVVRTIIPGTVGNTPAAFPYLGNNVVADEAVRLGWFEIPKSDSEMNIFPMPHA